MEKNCATGCDWYSSIKEKKLSANSFKFLPKPLNSLFWISLTQSTPPYFDLFTPKWSCIFYSSIIVVLTPIVKTETENVSYFYFILLHLRYNLLFPLWPSKFIKCFITVEGFLVFHKIYFTSSQLEVYSYYRIMIHVFANIFIRYFAFLNWNKCPIHVALIHRIPKRKFKGRVCNYHWEMHV